MSQSEISRIELGQIEALPVAKLERVVLALGAALDVRIRWNGEAMDRLLDAAHAAVVEAVVVLLERSGWAVTPEVTFAIRGERGSIDVLGLRPTTDDLLVVEVKSVIPDLQATLALLDRKARLAPLIARDRGLPTSLRVSRLLVLAASGTNRRRVEAHGAMLTAALPQRGRTVVRWLRGISSTPGTVAGLLFLSSTQAAGARRQQRIRGTG